MNHRALEPHIWGDWGRSGVAFLFPVCLFVKLWAAVGEEASETSENSCNESSYTFIDSDRR